MAARNVQLQFGLISIPARTEVATEKAPSFSNLCTGQPGKDKHEPAPLKQPRTCDECGPVVDYDAIVKGQKNGKTYTIVDPAEIEAAKEKYAGEYKGVINLVPHPASDFLANTAPGDSVHYLTPADKAGEGHYQLLVKLIESHPELAFASLYTPVSATSLYRVTARDGVLVLEKRTRGEAMKPVPSVGGEVNEGLYAMLESTLEQFVTPYDPTAYEDKYGAAVKELLEAGDQVTVAGGGETVATPVQQSDEDLMAKLKALQEAA